MKRFVITNKKIEWAIPFEHTLVTVGSYYEPHAINSSELLEPEINGNRTFALFRGIEAILKTLETSSNPEEMLAAFTHRGYLGGDFSDDLNTAFPDQLTRRIVTPQELAKDWENLILNDPPADVDYVIVKPYDFGVSVLEQYARAHHLEDILYCMAIAAEMEICDPIVMAKFLSGNFFWNSLFAAKTKHFVEIYEVAVRVGHFFYETQYVPRHGYQERAINFLLERIVALLLFERIYISGAKALVVTGCTVDPMGVYRRSE